MKTGKVTDKSELFGFSLVAALFIASGFSSLIYQVVWTRMLTLVFGSTTFPTATVLSVFMGGLAAGSLAAGLVADRLRRPFLWYGILEGAIGLWALAVPLLFTLVVPLYRTIWQQWHPDFLLFSLLRAALALVILIMPTACMGATLPLLSRFVISSLAYIGDRVGTLYSANTLGAVAGAITAGFILLPCLGLSLSTIAAASINLLLCLCVVLVSPRLKRRIDKQDVLAPVVPESPAEPAATGQAAAAPPAGSEPAKFSWALSFAALSFGVSGGLAMIYEVGWTRTLLMVIGSSTYAFTVMLSSFLIGIFAGSLICARYIDRARNPAAWFAASQLGVCLFSLLALQEFNYLPWWNLQINALFPHDPVASIAVRFLLSAAILLPLTLCLGAAFPSIVKACARQLAAVGRSVGFLYSVNTFGAITGAFAAGFILIPAVGVERMLVLASAANAVLGIILLLMLKEVSVATRLLCLAASIPILYCFSISRDIWDRMIIVVAQGQRRDLTRRFGGFDSYNKWHDKLYDDGRLLFWNDGASSTVGVMYWVDTGRQTLVTNGHVDAGDGVDRATQGLISCFPLLWKPDAKDVAVVGWGSGMSVGTATLFPVKSITAIELEPAVIKASTFFHHINHSPEKDPRVHIEANDGRNYLLATGKKFDVIISEPSNPWQAGVCNLFTREYFQICADRLAPGGVFSCWMQTAEIPPASLKSIIASLRSVFRYNIIFRLDRVNLAVLASDQPLTINYRTLADAFSRNDKVSEELRGLNLASPDAVLSRIVAAPDGVDELVAGANLNSDDSNELEYAVGRTYENTIFIKENRELLTPYLGSPWKLVKFANEQMVALELAEIGRQALVSDRFNCALAWASASLAVTPSADGFRVAGAALAQMGRRAEAQSMWAQTLKLCPGDIDTILIRGLDALQSGDAQAARKDFLSVLAMQPKNQMAKYYLAQTFASYVALHFFYGGAPVFLPSHIKDQSPDKVLELLLPLVDNSTFGLHHHSAIFLVGQAFLEKGDLVKAEQHLKKFLALEHDSVTGRVVMEAVFDRQGEKDKARKIWSPPFADRADASSRLFNRALTMQRAGRQDQVLYLLLQCLELTPGDARVHDMFATLSRTDREAAILLSNLEALGVFAANKKQEGASYAAPK